MWFDLFSSFKHALMITGFVFVMMLVIEYINVQSKGLWLGMVSGNRWKQYLLAALLGAIPGCLGAFTAVALFTHGMISFGAVVAAMIATSGDEAFVMFAMFPQKALGLTLILFFLSILAAYLTDKIKLIQKSQKKLTLHAFPLHEEENCHCFQKNQLLGQLKNPSAHRVVLFLVVAVLMFAIATGWIAADAKSWIKFSLFLVLTISLFIVSTVPDHFLDEHLWGHVMKKHAPKIFLWTFGTLLFIAIAMHYVDVQSWISGNRWLVLLMAVLIGVIPESGPHLIFVTLFAQGSIPFSLLLASSVVQDGHGMLPLLAESQRSFLMVKLVNIIFGFIVGLAGYLVGF